MSLIPKKGNVYVVDDDEAVRDSLQWLLEGKDYRVKCFDSAESFLTRYDPREVACLIADIRMDGMTGLELQDRLIERKSPLPIVFITGHGDVPWEQCFRMLNTIGYDGPISVEWEDAGMDRLVGAPEALEFVRRLAFDAPEAAFDAAFSSKE